MNNYTILTTDELQRIEREAHAMRAQVAAEFFAGLGRKFAALRNAIGNAFNRAQHI